MKKISGILTISSLAVVWILTIKQLSLEWSVNTLYSYGWWVPILGVYLLWERAQRIPPLQKSRGSTFLTCLLSIVFVLLYLPLRIFQEANQDWILINWILTILAVLTTLVVLYSVAGKSWLLHFGFPIIFIFTAVPWPVVLENQILQALMRINAVFSAELLTIMGHIAISQGNVIYVAGEFINVDDACSGIRSLQTSFMMSLFLGEFYRINPLKRILLVIISFAVAFVVNLGRTFALSYVGGTQGAEAIANWHDPIGYTALIIGIGSLWLIAYQLSKQAAKDAPKEMAQKKSPLKWSFFKNLKYPTALAVTILATVVVSEIATEIWYGSKEKNLVESVQWTVEWPENVSNFEEEQFSEITKTILKFNEGKSASWTTENGYFWGMYLLEWEEGRVSKSLAGAHSPDICLPAAGYTLHSFLGIRKVDLGDFRLPFRTYLFRSSETKYFYVFHCIWENKHYPGEELLEKGRLSRQSRINSVISGKRNLGQKVLGVSIEGPHSLEEALSELQEMLNTTIVTSEEPIS